MGYPQLMDWGCKLIFKSLRGRIILADLNYSSIPLRLNFTECKWIVYAYMLDHVESRIQIGSSVSRLVGSKESLLVLQWNRPWNKPTSASVKLITREDHVQTSTWSLHLFQERGSPLSQLIGNGQWHFMWSLGNIFRTLEWTARAILWKKHALHFSVRDMSVKVVTTKPLRGAFCLEFVAV